MNNIRKLREQRGWTQKQLADLAGTSYQQIYKLEKSTRKLSVDWLNTLGKAFGVNPAEIAGFDPINSSIPVEAYVGAGAEVYSLGEHSSLAEYVPSPPEVGTSTIKAVVVRGDSMYPVYRDGDTIYYTEYHGSADDLIGKECVVMLEDGRQMVKTIMKGSQPNTFTLTSYNAAPIENIKVIWASPVLWAKRKS